jgi:hypothetical protein
MKGDSKLVFFFLVNFHDFVRKKTEGVMKDVKDFVAKNGPKSSHYEKKNPKVVTFRY